MFDKLPGRIDPIPVQHFQPLPQRQIIPTAALAAQLMDQINKLSPAEREKEKLKMQLLQAALYEHNGRIEHQQIINRQLNQNLQQHEQQKSDFYKTFFGSPRADVGDSPPYITDYSHPHPVHIDEIPTTHPADLYPQSENESTPV